MSSSSISRFEDLFETRSGDLGQPRDLALAHTSVEGLTGEDADRIALGLGLLARPGSGAAVADERVSEFVGHARIVLDNDTTA